MEAVELWSVIVGLEVLKRFCLTWGIGPAKDTQSTELTQAAITSR